jgi:putative ABC transport system permease protein
MRALADDGRFALRALSRRPWLTIVAVLTLVLGIAGATTAFSVADAVVLRPLPYLDPDRLVIIWQSDRARNQPFIEISYPAFREWRDRSRQFESIAAMSSVNFEMVLTGRGEPAVLAAGAVTGSFFRLLGALPMFGRVLLPRDEEPGAPAVVVLSEALWRDRFASDPEVVGKSMILDGRAFTIVGVLPADVQYPRGARLWIPLQLQPGLRDNAGVMWMLGLGRLKPGASIESARTELTQLWRQMQQRLAPDGADTSRLEASVAVLTPLAEVIFGSTRSAVLAIFAAGLLVLLAACSNVTGLLLVQATDRRRETAVRHVLGASRARLARAAFLETLLVALVAGIGGLAVTHAALPVIVALSPLGVPRLQDTAMNTRAFGFALLAAALAAILSALAPVLLAGRTSLAIRDSRSRVAHAGGRVRSALVVMQIAVSAALLIGAGLLVRSFITLREAPLGFEPGPVLAATVSPAGETYADISRWRVFYQELLDRVRVLPGVTSAAALTRRPLWNTVGYDWPFTIEGQTGQEAARNPLLNLMAVSADYFRTMGIPVRRGRVLSDADAEGQPGVVVVSASLAARVWPGLDPIGRRIRLPLPGTEYHDAWLTVVGVVADARYREITGARLDLYMSWLQANLPVNNLMVRSNGDPAALARAVTDVVHGLNPNVPVTETVPMARVVDEALGHPRFAARLFSGFALMAIALAALGVYALMAHWVTSRTREIGVRMALGARPGNVLHLVFTHALSLAAVGVTIGVLAAAAGTPLIRALLYQVSDWDAVAFGGAAVTVPCLVAAACLLPALRATRVDPASALRAE